MACIRVTAVKTPRAKPASSDPAAVEIHFVGSAKLGDGHT